MSETICSKKPLALAIGGAFAATLAAAPIANAAENPFGMIELSSGYVQLAGKEGNCGEGKCGGSKATGKSAEGKCGGDMKSAAEGKCGGDMKSAAEGKCGGDMKSGAKSASEGKCGEGKCGGNK